jgi:hypothetical protein
MEKRIEYVPEGYHEILVSWITLGSGWRLYASSYGLRSFRLVVRTKA